MKIEFAPYYISRALLSIIFSILIMGFNWKGIVFATVLFGLFLLYLHSGWFSIDLRYPLTPLRRDARAQAVQRKALIAAVTVGILLYLFSSQLSGLFSLSLAGNIALSIGILTYFVTQFILLARA
jgi:hypothetical protein